MNQYLDAAIKAARAAGALVRENFGRPLKVNVEEAHDIKLELDVRRSVAVVVQVRFVIQDLAGGQGELRLEIGRIDLEKQIPFFHLLVIMDRFCDFRQETSARNQ